MFVSEGSLASGGSLEQFGARLFQFDEGLLHGVEADFHIMLKRFSLLALMQSPSSADGVLGFEGRNSCFDLGEFLSIVGQGRLE